MISISVSLKNSQDNSLPTRLVQRVETDGELANEDSEEFIEKHKKRKRKRKRSTAIPDAANTEPGADNNGRVRTTKANWLGRMIRDGAPKRSRIKGIKNKT